MAINLAILLASWRYLEARSSKTSCTCFSGAFRICSFCIYPRKGDNYRQPEQLTTYFRHKVGTHGAKTLQQFLSPMAKGTSDFLYSAFDLSGGEA
jgi:hypothetical protein